MSLSGPRSKASNQVIKLLTDNGIHVVVAAGNDGSDACLRSPASEKLAITVGAIDDKSDNVTNFSNFGKCVDIFAPGRGIQSVGTKNDTDTVIFSGTSQATPHVAGTVALLISKFGNQKPRKMKKTLIKFSTKNIIPNTKGSSNNFLRIPSP